MKHPVHIIGPTGCGKTLLALQIAKELGIEERVLIRFMQEWKITYQFPDIHKSKAEILASFKLEREKGLGASFLNRIKVRDLVVAFLQLEQLDRAGVSILDSIHDLKETSESVKVRNLMSDVYDSIKNGNLFSL